jgi:hypothetical protein
VSRSAPSPNGLSPVPLQLRVVDFSKFRGKPVLVLTGTNDLGHARAVDEPIADWLNANGAKADFIYLGDLGITGNGRRGYGVPSKPSEADKFYLQQCITRCYGSLTTFNILFKNKGRPVPKGSLGQRSLRSTGAAIIENGKITKPVRQNECQMFRFNPTSAPLPPLDLTPLPPLHLTSPLCLD